MYQYTKDVFGKDVKIVIAHHENIREENQVSATVDFKGTNQKFSVYSKHSFIMKPIHGSSEFAAFIHDCTNKEAMIASVKKAIVSNFRYVFISNHKSYDMFKFLPSYFDDDVDCIASYCIKKNSHIILKLKLID